MLPWLGVALIVLLVDQLSKIAALRTLSYAWPHRIAPFFSLRLANNVGAAFSFLASANGWQRWAFIGFGLLAAAVIAYLLKRHSHQRLFCSALALILGGALGNVTDRILRGHVIDFIDLHVGRWHWPTFNLADSAITVGAILLILDELLRVRATR
jgi:signal peptidase II